MDWGWIGDGLGMDWEPAKQAFSGRDSSALLSLDCHAIRWIANDISTLEIQYNEQKSFYLRILRR
jgi:hypothetical protein